MGTPAPTTKATRQAGEPVKLFATNRPIARTVELCRVANIVILFEYQGRTWRKVKEHTMYWVLMAMGAGILSPAASYSNGEYTFGSGPKESELMGQGEGHIRVGRRNAPASSPTPNSMPGDT